MEYYGTAYDYEGGDGTSLVKNLDCFMEIVGSANYERTGHIQREVEYGGWLYGTDGVWHLCDKGNASSSDLGTATNPTYRLWYVSEDGSKFVLKLIGIYYYDHKGINTFVLPNPAPLPSYLQNTTSDTIAEYKVDIRLLNPSQTTTAGLATAQVIIIQLKIYLSLKFIGIL